MTAYINKIANKAGVQQLPVTHERAVRDDNGTTLESKLQNLEGAMDKAYVASSDNGMGRITLKKNMVSGVNTLTQSMLQATNTIYVIRYDFTLGEDITVPDNCILEFDGGSISASGSNDTITGAKTCISASLVKIFNTNITLAGSWNVVEAYPEWFGAVGDGVTDDTAAIQYCIHAFKKVVCNQNYLCTSTLFINKQSSIFVCNGSINYSGNAMAMVVQGYYNKVFISRLLCPNGNGIHLGGITEGGLENADIMLDYCEAKGHCLYYHAANNNNLQFVQYCKIDGRRWNSVESSPMSVTFNDGTNANNKWFNSNYIYNVECSARSSEESAFELVGPSGTRTNIDENVFIAISGEGGANSIELANASKNKFYTVRFSDNSGTLINLYGLHEDNVFYGVHMKASGITNNITGGLCYFYGVILNDDYSCIANELTLGYIRNTVQTLRKTFGAVGSAEADSYQRITGNIDMSSVTGIGNYAFPRAISDHICICEDGVTLTLSPAIFGCYKVSSIKVTFDTPMRVPSKVIYGTQELYITKACEILFVPNGTNNYGSIMKIKEEPDSLATTIQSNSATIKIPYANYHVFSGLLKFEMRSRTDDTKIGLYHIVINSDGSITSAKIHESQNTPYYGFGETSITYSGGILTLNVNYTGYSQGVSTDGRASIVY